MSRVDNGYYYIHVRSRLQHTLLLHFLYKYMGYVYDKNDTIGIRDSWYWVWDFGCESYTGAVVIDHKIKSVEGGQSGWSIERCCCDADFFINNFDALITGKKMGLL